VSQFEASKRRLDVYEFVLVVRTLGADLEEAYNSERHLLYVACTRHVIIYW